jgi:hypothetical protein
LPDRWQPYPIDRFLPITFTGKTFDGIGRRYDLPVKNSFELQKHPYRNTLVCIVVHKHIDHLQTAVIHDQQADIRFSPDRDIVF